MGGSREDEVRKVGTRSGQPRRKVGIKSGKDLILFGSVLITSQKISLQRMQKW